MTTLHMNLGEHSYDIFVGHGLLSHAGEYFNLARRVFIVTDDGVPGEYAKKIADCAAVAKIVTVPSGEGSKSIEVYSRLLSEMSEFGLTRTDCAVAVGGGVVGDLTGFAAASYMRGIDFYNVPTTLLSQVDSSIGGKCAVNHAGVKNIVGAFHQPRGVIVDIDTLKTLPERQIFAGLAESVKMALTSDKELFSIIEGGVSEKNIENALKAISLFDPLGYELDIREEYEFVTKNDKIHHIPLNQDVVNRVFIDVINDYHKRQLIPLYMLRRILNTLPTSKLY